MKYIRSSIWLLPLVLLLTGCIEDGPTSPALQSSIFSLLGGLEPGEALTLEGENADEFFLPGGENGAEYVIVPFYASDSSFVQVTIRGAEVLATAGPPYASRTPVRSTGQLAFGPLQRNRRFHMRLRRWETRVLGRHLGGSIGQGGGPPVSAERTAGPAAVPEVGDIIPLKVPNFDDGTPTLCDHPLQRHARVAAVSDNVIIAIDTANPPGGFTRERVERFAQRFDQLVYPVETENFGEPSDIDENGRVIAFFTAVVNELTPPNAGFIIGGFFFAGDLFPDGEPPPPDPEAPSFVCRESNEAELFYLLAPDPQGRINNNPRPTEQVAQRALGIIGHEFQHLINASRRIYVNNARRFEVAWLNEGLSHIAEELLFYAAGPFEPRQNITLQDLRTQGSNSNALLQFQIDNLIRYYLYVREPSEESLIGIPTLDTRGAAWAFLRYAADQEEGPDQDFFFNLVNTQTTGIRNLSTALHFDDVVEDADALDLIQTWTVSVYSDDAPTVQNIPLLLRQPSWGYRSILSFFEQQIVGENDYPLDLKRLGETGIVRVTLEAGGAAFIQIEVDAGVQARIDTSAGSVSPGALRVSVIRIN